MRGLVLIGTVIAALVALAAGASGAGAPKAFVARYHLSAYGVYHRTYREQNQYDPCRPGGHGGGDDGTITHTETIRWETVAPATAVVTRILPGLPPTLNVLRSRNTIGPGIVATARVTITVSGNVDKVTCNLDGTEDRLAAPYATQCGSHTYTRGYAAGVVWPRILGRQGQRFAVGIEQLPRVNDQFNKDYAAAHCWGPHVRDYQETAVINGPLPFANLPRKVHGKLTAIAHGGKVEVDATQQQGGDPAATTHIHDAWSGTSYVTFVRIR